MSYHGDERPKTCPDCGKLVGDDGLTRVSLVGGEPYSTVLYFTAPRQPEPVPDGVTRTLTLEDRPENPEPPDLHELANRVIIIDPQPDNPEELPPGCE